MAWFEIRGEEIWTSDYIPSSMGGEHHRYGIRIGGEWCLDYWFKLMFDLSNDDWENRCSHMKTNKDFYDLCEWLGIYYMKDGIIYRKGEQYDQIGNKL